MGTGSLDSGVSKQAEATSTSSPSPNLSPTLASLRASLNSLNDSATDSMASSLNLESRYRPSQGKTPVRPSSVPLPDGNSVRLPTKSEAHVGRGQSLKRNNSLTTQELWKIFENAGKGETLEEEKSKMQKDEDMTRISSQAKAAKLLGIENLPNHPFSFQSENNNDSNLREAADHKARIASWNGEESRHGERGLSKAARILGLANIPDHPQRLLEEQVEKETLNKHRRSISPTNVRVVAFPPTQQSLHRGSWEKAAKVLGVADIFDPTFSKEKRDQKGFEPKEEKARERGRNDEMKKTWYEGKGIKSKSPNARGQNNESQEKRFVDVSRKLYTEGSTHEGKEEKSKNARRGQNNTIKEEQEEDLRCSNSRRSKRQRSVSRQWSKVKEAMHPNN